VSRFCEHFDCGWCYKTNSIYVDGCVGVDNCAYFQDEKDDNKRVFSCSFCSHEFVEANNELEAQEIMRELIIDNIDMSDILAFCEYTEQTK
jgi:hypothetical protein